MKNDNIFQKRFWNFDLAWIINLTTQKRPFGQFFDFTCEGEMDRPTRISSIIKVYWYINMFVFFNTNRKHVVIEQHHTRLMLWGSLFYWSLH